MSDKDRYQSEALLEDNFINNLVSNGYERVQLNNYSDLKSNFKTQLEKHNNIELTDQEFKSVLNHLDGGSIFHKAQKIRDKYELIREDGVKYLTFIDPDSYGKNIFQVTNQITDIGKYETRYDITILINGLPLCQIELKRRGIDIGEAFNQVERYQKHSLTGLFRYIQIFVISNGVETKYFSNNQSLSKLQTFYWTDEKNTRITDHEGFSNIFLDRSHLSRMITRYIVLHHTKEILMILRPYQYFAVEAITKRVENSTKNGYIWHTTGSGKTLTSFKTSQLLTNNNNVDKVIFVVDRKDLDNQTQKEFNNFSKGSVDSTDNTDSLVKQLASSQKLVTTTIQKMSNAVKKDRHSKSMMGVKDKRVIFIFDECHRSQFGDMHKDITNFFTNTQCFGFTGTPILAENNNKKKTTIDLFEKCLHTYVITDAIADNNVLGFAVEYESTFQEKESTQDLDVEAIDTDEVFLSDRRVEEVTNFIISNYDRKTHNKEFTSMLAVAGVPLLIKYYNQFKKLKEEGKHNLKIATIFSWNPNEETPDTQVAHSREMLDNFMSDYNQMFGSDYTTDTFSKYYFNIADRVKNKEIDILLVVNMFLTGFDSPSLNTLFIDKNISYHNLIQAFSRTNRLYTSKKDRGQIISFDRPSKDQVDKAIKLFSNENALDTVLTKPYMEHIDECNELIDEILLFTPDMASIDSLQSEEDKKQFVIDFRNLIRFINRLQTYTEFTYEDLNIDAQTFEDFKGKYFSIYEDVRNKNQKEKFSILDDLDFQIELIRRDYINVDYIITLIKDLDEEDPSYEDDKIRLLKKIDNSVELKSKKQLIEEFINNVLPTMGNKTYVDEAFYDFVYKKKDKELQYICEQAKLNYSMISEAVNTYNFTGKLERDLLKDALPDGLKLLEKKRKITELEDTLKHYNNKYDF